MSFHALLVSGDSETAATLAPVLASFGLELRCCAYGDVLGELTAQKFDAIIVDFEDAQQAGVVLQNAYLASPRNAAVTVALLSDQSKVRSAFGAGAHFVLYKPVSPEQAQASLRAASILIKRERRRASRVPVQVPVRLCVTDLELEAILLDLSEEGMELLASEPLCPSAALNLQFALPGSNLPLQMRGEVAWASPNGQTGVRFVGLPERVRKILAAWVSANARKPAPEDPEPVTSYKLSDISQGGCYVETESPFPEHTMAFLNPSWKGKEITLQGLVRVMHPGFGMGMEFASQTDQESTRLKDFIAFLIDSPDAQPEIRISPCGLAAGADLCAPENVPSKMDDALLELLHTHELLTQADFLQKLHRQRRPVQVTASKPY